MEGSLEVFDGVESAEVKRTHEKHAGVPVNIAQKEAIRRRIAITNLLERKKLRS